MRDDQGWIALALTVLVMLLVSSFVPILEPATNLQSSSFLLGSSRTSAPLIFGGASAGRIPSASAAPIDRSGTAAIPVSSTERAASVTQPGPNDGSGPYTAAPAPFVADGLSLPDNSPPAPAGLTIVTGFEGAHYGDNGGTLDYLSPPDVPLAAGPSHVVEIVNGLVLMWTKDGTLVKQTTPPAFFQAPDTHGVGDPRILYDAASGRWFASAGDFTVGNAVLAVSTSGDPTGGWTTTNLSTGGRCPDQPLLGLTSDKVVVFVNVFSGCSGGFYGGEVWVLNKTDLVNGATPRYTILGPSTSYDSMFPAHSLSSTTTQFMVRSISPNILRVYSVTGVPPGGVSITSKDYTVATMGGIVNAVQPGTSVTLIMGDSRVRDAFWKNGRLWLALNDGCIPAGDSSTRACFRVSQLDTTNQTVAQDLDVGAVGMYYFFPALRLDAFGNLVVVFGGSSSSVYPSVLASYRLASDPANTLKPAITVRAGNASETPARGNCPSSNVCRWGDYFGTGADPSDGTVIWTAAEYSTSTGWRTYVSALRAATSNGVTFTVSYSVAGGGTGYQAPTFTYVQGGATKTATLTATPVAFTLDYGTSWSVTNPLGGSSGTERWSTNQATSGTATADATIVFAYTHQFAVTFQYQVVGGGSGYSAPTIAYAAYGASASTPVGVSVWADAGSTFTCPTSLSGSSSSEAWRTATPTGSIGGSGTITTTYYHQYSVKFAYSVLGGGTGYSAPTIAYTQFGAAASTAAGNTVWADASTSYQYTNPLAGSGSSERWMAATASGTVTASGTITAVYYHQFPVVFAYTVRGGGSGFSSPSVAYVTLGSAASTTVGASVWADAGSAYQFPVALPGSGSAEAWRTNQGTGTIAQAGTISVPYYHQYAVSFTVQVVGGGLPGTTPQINCTQFGVTGKIDAGTTDWGDANGTYAFPGVFTGTNPGERWLSTTPPSGVIAGPTSVTATYYHQYSVTFAYQVIGGGSGFAAPTASYAALGTSLSTNAGATVWSDAGSSYSYTNPLSGSSGTERWLSAAASGTIGSSGTTTATYFHQFLVSFNYTVTGGGAGYSAPNVTVVGLGVAQTTPATGLWVWGDAGSTYTFQSPLPGSTTFESWRVKNASGTITASGTYTASYRHQYRMNFKAKSTGGSLTSESPLMNVTQFDTVVSLPADTVDWVDAGGWYSFPGVFYGPLPGERWITDAPPSGQVLAPANVTATYVHQFYLTIQVNASAGGTVTGAPGWYNETISLTLQAIASPGWRFEGWTGSGSGSYSGAASTANLQMDAPLTETAIFYAGITLSASSGGSLGYSFEGSGGWVPAGTTTTIYVAPGTRVAIDAQPGWFYEFQGWTGDASGTGSTDTILVDRPSSASASFGISLYSKIDSVLGVGVLLSVIIAISGTSRRRRRRRRVRALMAARARSIRP